MRRSTFTMSQGGFMLTRSKLRCMNNCRAVVRATRVAVNHASDLRWRRRRYALAQYASPMLMTIDGNAIAARKVRGLDNSESETITMGTIKTAPHA